MNLTTIIENFKRIQEALLIVGTLNLTTNYFYKDINVQDCDEYDLIIVGSGSAGSIVASRLSEIKNQKILLIEAGGNPPFESELPGLHTYMVKSEYDWNYTTTNDGYSSQCFKDHRQPLIRGKMLGGCSSINWFGYNRGNPYDYQKWAEAAQDPSWKWENILPYFIKLENLTDKCLLNSPYRKFHGTNGIVKLKRYYSDKYKELLESFIEIGENVLPDVTANEFLGFSEPLLTIGDGIRQSTANTYLITAQNRENLDIIKNTLATKVIFDVNLRAIGVKVIDKHNRKRYIKSKKEVILSAGAIGTPQLLMLSGIGPKNHLRSKDIPILVDLPVGQNLQDHVSNLFYYKIETSSNNELSNSREFDAPVLGFISLNKTQIQPDFQVSSFFSDGNYIFQQCVQYYEYQTEYCQNLYKEVKGQKALALVTNLFYEKSRGKILLKSKDPKEYPNIYTGFYSNRNDIDNHVKYIQHLLKLEETDYFKRINAKLIDPKFKPCADFKFKTEEFWECYLLCGAIVDLHQTSTCAMGSVVDSRLRVYGVQNLRVADASIMPIVPGANTNGPTMMIGEKASDMIKEDHNLCVS